MYFHFISPADDDFFGTAKNEQLSSRLSNMITDQMVLRLEFQTFKFDVEIFWQRNQKKKKCERFFFFCPCDRPTFSQSKAINSITISFTFKENILQEMIWDGKKGQNSHPKRIRVIAEWNGFVQHTRNSNERFSVN